MSTSDGRNSSPGVIKIPLEKITKMHEWINILWNKKEIGTNIIMKYREVYILKCCINIIIWKFVWTWATERRKIRAGGGSVVFATWRSPVDCRWRKGVERPTGKGFVNRTQLGINSFTNFYDNFYTKLLSCIIYSYFCFYLLLVFQ